MTRNSINKMNWTNLIKCLFGIFLITVVGSCKEDSEDPSPINLSDTYSECNSFLPDCLGTSGDYCLLGFKWGTDPVLDESGVDVLGPQQSGGMLTYSFQEENGIVNTHRQVNLPSKSFDNIIDCAKEEIKNALNTWSQTAGIDFAELPDNSASDIRFFVADIVQRGIGYPNYPDALCSTIKGNLIIKTDNSIDSCNDFYVFALHEIGHILGLGHTTSESIMHSEYFNFDFEDLQAGDINGIIELYGEN